MLVYASSNKLCHVHIKCTFFIFEPLFYKQFEWLESVCAYMYLLEWSMKLLDDFCCMLLISWCLIDVDKDLFHFMREIVNCGSVELQSFSIAMMRV